MELRELYLRKEKQSVVENLVLTRIDDRLIHGQVMTWIKNKKATQVVIVDDLVTRR